MAHAKRIAVPFRASPHRCIRDDQERVPWATIVLLVLVLVVIMALWGKLPARLKQLHQAPRGNAPGVSHLSIENPSRLRLA